MENFPTKSQQIAPPPPTPQFNLKLNCLSGWRRTAAAVLLLLSVLLLPACALGGGSDSTSITDGGNGNDGNNGDGNDGDNGDGGDGDDGDNGDGGGSNPTPPSGPPGFEIVNPPTDSLSVAERLRGWGVFATGAAVMHWARCSTRTDCASEGVDPNAYVRGGGVTIAVVDTGTDETHSDLASNIVLPANARPILTEMQDNYLPDPADGEPHNFFTFNGYAIGGNDQTEYAVSIVYGGDATIHMLEGSMILCRASDLDSRDPETGFHNCNFSNIATLTAGDSYEIPADGFYDGINDGINRYFGPSEGVVSAGEDHGTHVAGIAAGNLNQDGIVGVAPDAKILPLTFLYGGARNPLSLAESYAYAAANNAFVANNSWGYREHYVQITITEPLGTQDGGLVDDEKIWIWIPAYYNYTTTGNGGIRITSPNGHVDASTIADESGDDMLIVFAQGNSYWNSKTGIISFVTDECVDVFLDGDPETECEIDGEHGPIDMSTYGQQNLDTMTVYGYGYVELDEGEIVDAIRITTETGVPATISGFGGNMGDSLTSAPLTDTSLDLIDRWLNVVAVDASMVIADFSNGCGETKDFCLAAPGVDVESSLPDNTTGPNSGTSMAAPHVSGLAALLKGAFPNLSATQVQDIILESADGLGVCADETDKNTPCTDDVYGHGVMNAIAAFEPRFTSPAGDNTNAASIASSRINLSPAFSDAPWRETQTNIGVLDDYGRVFQSYLNLNDGIVVGTPQVDDDGNITGTNAHATFASPLHSTTANFHYNHLFGSVLDDHDTLTHHSEHFNFVRDYYGGYTAYQTAYQIDDNNAFAVQRRNGSATHLPSDKQLHGFYKPAFIDEERDALQYTHRNGSGAMSFMAERGASGSQTAARLSYNVDGVDGLAVFAEGGVVREDDSVLGAVYTGIYETKMAATRYERFGFDYHLSTGAESDDVDDTAIRFYADYLRAKTRAGEVGGIVESYTSTAARWTSGMSYGGWDLSWSQPLAVVDGNWRWRYIDGYTADGDYSTATKDIDLSSTRREQIFSLHYRGERATAPGHLYYAFGVDYLRNAAAHQHRGGLFNLTAAARLHF